jgi:uncharacterized protein
MFKSVLCAAAVAAAVLVSPAAQAQAAGASKKELVARVLQLQQPAIEAMAKGLAEQPALQMMQAAGPAIQRLPAERREAVARDVEADLRKYADEAVPIVRDKAVKLAPSTIGVLLEERFTEDELRQVVAILESPLQRKFTGMQNDMQRALVEKLVADSKGDIEPKVRTMQQTVAKRLGVTPPPAAGASGGKR